LFGCDGLICTNPEYYERNKKRWNSKLIPNGVDCTRFQLGAAERHRFNLPTVGLVVLMVSALVPNKRVELGIEAVSKISGAHLVIAGDGPLRQSVDHCAARLLPGKFTRLSLTPQEMPNLYRSADVFLHLCKDESFGNVFLEAMACGLPIVAHDSSRTRWIVGDDEFLIDSSDPAEISKKVITARECKSPSKSERNRKAAAFSWTRIGDTYSKFLNDIVISKSGPKNGP
jgi:glycosyltransferase involved in cell wall biosynthesis